MIKGKKSISINIISAFLILTSLFMLCVKQTNAWFTSTHFRGMQIVAQIGNLDLNLYQDINGSETEILTNEDNAKDGKTQYIQLSKSIAPDEDIDLTLKIVNEDSGSTSMYVKFQFAIYARGVASDTLIPSTIEGFTAPNENQSGFVYNSTDKFYYLKDNSGNNVVLKSLKQLTEEAKDQGVEESELPTTGEKVTLLTKFKIPYSSFINEDNSLKYINSDTIYIKLTVVASISSTFAQ